MNYAGKDMNIGVVEVLHGMSYLGIALQILPLRVTLNSGDSLLYLSFMGIRENKCQ